ncbi:MAG: helix-turn-helix domain-containing protein [Chloroflexi bacterium]|nr:helix-turn-helix domain-containing protein [Chloroflexota bacterium]
MALTLDGHSVMCHHLSMATKTLKYRIYPSKAQRTAMQVSLDACRWVYHKT